MFFSARQRLVLGQRATAETSDEITAIPLLLERLALTGALVTIDVMGATARVARAVLDRGADYLLALKTNQGHLLEEAELCFHDASDIGTDRFQTVDADHGRIETRAAPSAVTCPGCAPTAPRPASRASPACTSANADDGPTANPAE